MRSRERKKLYMKDLEMKSKYLEGECRRLGRLLQCCYAENQALRVTLQMGGAFGASATKQESAVLLMGMNCQQNNSLHTIFLHIMPCVFLISLKEIEKNWNCATSLWNFFRMMSDFREFHREPCRI